MTRFVLVLVLGLAVLTASCSFIDDFDYDFADAGLDSGVTDSATDAVTDASVPPCAAPCLGDAVEDFSAGTQGAGALMWRYLSDGRELPGLAYGELNPDSIFDAPAWSDGSAAPAIVACGSSTTGACADSAGGLVFEVDPPGDSSDPVLAFIAPTDGTYQVVADVRNIFGSAEILLGRNGRLDTAVVAPILTTEGTRVSGLVELFAGEQGLVTVRPAGSGPATIGAGVRVSTASGPPLQDCELALRFDDTDNPLRADCGSFLVMEEESIATASSAGPNGTGGARVILNGSALRVEGARLDYSGDFTVQMWIQVNELLDRDSAAYSDWSAFDPATAGGVSIWFDPTSADGAIENAVTAGYLFPLPATVPTGPGIVDCDTDSCGVDIVAPIPSLSDWHFYRVVRDSAADEVRFCIDGELAGRGVLPGDIDVSNPADPKLGTFGGRSGSNFQGIVDDVRIFSRALPCE